MAATPQENRGSIVSGSSIIAAGLASAVAAAVTSSAGWAGTLIGAAITTMIITGGSAILNAYLQSMKGRVQAAPGNIRAAARRARPQGGERLPDNPRLRDNFVGRLRGALGWFSRLPTHQRRSILKRGLIGAIAAFVIGILVITAVEFGIGNSYSCGFWGNCSAGSAPGFGGGNAYMADGSGPGYSIFGGGSSGAGQQSPYDQPGGGVPFGGEDQIPSQPQQPGGGGFFDGGGQPDGGVQPQQPLPEQPLPEEPAQPQQPLPEEEPAAPVE